MKFELTLPVLLAVSGTLVGVSARPLEHGAGIATIALRKVVRESDEHPQIVRLLPYYPVILYLTWVFVADISCIKDASTARTSVSRA